MKIVNVKNAKAFFAAVEECEGSVELCTEEGDRLNLKSTLCQYLALTQMFDEAKMDMDLLISEPEDYERLKGFLVLPE